MKLVTVGARNMKGSTFLLNLSPFTLIVGDNWSGKSARMDAIRLLLLGYLPELGKTARATFGLCSGRELVVEGTFDTGERIVRRWFLKGDTVKTEETIPPSFENIGEIVSVMLNAETYFGLSEQQRMNYVFANIGLGGAYTRDRIEEKLTGDLLGTEGLDAEAIAQFSADLRDALRSSELPSTSSPQELLQWSLDWIGEHVREKRTQAGIMEKTAQGLAYLRTLDGSNPEELPSVEREIQLATEKINALTEKKGALVAAVERDKRTRARRSVLEAELRERPNLVRQKEQIEERLRLLNEAAAAIDAPAPDVVEDLRKHDRDASLRRQDAVREQQRIENALRTPPVDRTPFVAERDAASAQLEELYLAISKVEASPPHVVSEMERTLREAREGLGRLDSDLAVVDSGLDRNHTEARELEGKTRCAYCGASGEGWKVIKAAELKSAIAGLEQKRTLLVNQITAVREFVADTEARLKKANAATSSVFELTHKIETAKANAKAAAEKLAAVDAKRGEFEKLREELSTATFRAEAATRAAKVAEEALQKANELRSARDGKDREIRERNDALESLTRILGQLAAKAEELTGLPVESNSDELVAVQEQADQLTRKREELRAKAKALSGRANDLRRLAEAEHNRDKTKTSEAVAKAALAAAQEMQANLVADAFKPLLAEANSFFLDVLKTPLAYNGGEIGTWREGTWVGHRTFSGAEKRLAYVAIQAALTARDPFRIMLLDEMGTMQDENAMKVARAIGAALERNKLDQFVGIDVGRALLYSAEAEFNGSPLTLEVVG